MKRGVVALLMFTMIGCGGASEEPRAEESEKTSPSPTATTTTAEPSPSPTSEETTSEPVDPYEGYRDEDGFVASEDYGSDWPLTVDAGFLGCPESFGEGAGSVTFTTLDGDEYALNGQATHDYPEIRPITIKGAIALPLLEDALELC